MYFRHPRNQLVGVVCLDELTLVPFLRTSQAQKCSISSITFRSIIQFPLKIGQSQREKITELTVVKYVAGVNIQQT